MKKRQRKKLHLKEFQELGFKLIITYIEGLNKRTLNEQLDWLICEAEKKDLVISGGITELERTGEFFIMRHKGTCTEKDREDITQTLSINKVIVSSWVGRLRDSWYPQPLDIEGHL